MVPKQILCATDLATSGQEACQLAGRLAELFQAELILVHATDTTDWAPPTGPSSAAIAAMQEQLQGANASAQKALHAQRASFEERGIRVRCHLQHGRPWSAILEAAKQDEASLIVVGARPREERSLLDRVIGSTAERVVRHATSDVLVTTGDGPADWKGAKIVVAVDFSGTSLRALDIAVHASNALTGSLHLLHIAPDPLEPEMGPEKYKETQARLKSETEDALRALLKERGAEGNGYCRFGSPGPVVADLTAEIDADMIVLGSRGQSRFRGIMLGSTTERVLRRATIPVWVVRPESNA
ncbi:MAG: universal stress protein [Myxococcota bacterium]